MATERKRRSPERTGITPAAFVAWQHCAMKKRITDCTTYNPDTATLVARSLVA